MRKPYLSDKQHGMTLVEILIALALGVFLIGGLLQIFQGSSQSSRMLDNLSRIQENGRFAIHFMTRDIRSAGFRANLNGVSVCMNEIMLTAIAGTDDDDTDDAIADGTDTITILPSSCPGAGSPIIYSIRQVLNSNPARFSLYKNDGVSDLEVAEDIENMQILYGVDTDGDLTPNHFVPIDSVVNTGSIISIQVNLLVSSADDNLMSSPVAYTFNGVTTAAADVPDRRIRREFSATVALRNRLP